MFVQYKILSHLMSVFSAIFGKIKNMFEVKQQYYITMMTQFYYYYYYLLILLLLLF